MKERVLVSDVGGTNGRFAIAEFDNSQLPRIHSFKNFQCKNYKSFAQMLTVYLDILEGDVPNFAKHSEAGSDAKALTAPEITLAAKEGSNPLCVKTVEIFFSILGSVADDITLAHGAKGGIFIGGGIVPNIIELLNSSDFMVRFCNKGPMSRYVKDVPVHIITAKNPALLGAALANI